MSLCADSTTAVTDSIDESIREVFQMMAGTTLTRKNSLCRIRSAERQHDDSEISVVMGLTGDLQGLLSLSMDAAAAIRWTESLIDYQSDKIDQTVIDAVGELGNMVVGGAKRRLDGYSLTMSLPSVIRVASTEIEFPSSAAPIQVSFEYEGSILTILIALHKQCA